MRKQILFFVLAFTLMSSLLKAQESEFKMDIDFVSVVSGYRTHPMSLLPCDTLGDAYKPLVMTFLMSIENNSNKDYWLFGSNTKGHFWNDNSLFIRDGVMGRFYLVNSSDSILLYSYESSTIANVDKNLQYGASVNYMETLNDEEFGFFLCEFINRDDFAGKCQIFNYLKESKIVYVPIVEDYERIIRQKYLSISNNITYPNHPIEAKMFSPFYVVFGTIEDGDSKGVILGEEYFEEEPFN